MLWFAVWTLLVLAALGVFALLGLSLWRKGVALARELGAAAERLSAVTQRLEEARDAEPAELAVFADPALLRVERDRARKARARARHRTVRRA